MLPYQDYDDDRTVIQRINPPIARADKSEVKGKPMLDDLITPSKSSDDELPFSFGKYKDNLPSDVADINPGYIVWVFENVDPAKWFFPESLYVWCKKQPPSSR